MLDAGFLKDVRTEIDSCDWKNLGTEMDENQPDAGL